MPLSSSTTASPSRMAASTGSAATAAAIFGKRFVQSSPLRVFRRALPFSTKAISRYPSHLISCNHCGPFGTRSTSVAREGAMSFGIGSLFPRAPERGRFLAGDLVADLAADLAEDLA